MSRNISWSPKNGTPQMVHFLFNPFKGRKTIIIFASSTSQLPPAAVLHLSQQPRPLHLAVPSNSARHPGRSASSWRYLHGPHIRRKRNTCIYIYLRNRIDIFFGLLWVNPVMSQKNDLHMRIEALTRNKPVFFNMLLKKNVPVCWKNTVFGKNP